MKTLYYTLLHIWLQYDRVLEQSPNYKYVLKNILLELYFTKTDFHHGFPLFIQLNIYPLKHLFVFKVVNIFMQDLEIIQQNNQTRSHIQSLIKGPKII